MVGLTDARRARLAAFGVYALVVAVQGDDYRTPSGGAHYLSPFYSPDVRSLLGVDPPFSPAFLVLWAPLGLRATCYYYRKAYYRSYFLAPPACAVAGLERRRYRGEAGFPLVLQNAHRYFFYAATIVLGFLWYDALRAFLFESRRRARARRRPRHARPPRQRRPAVALHARLQLAPAPRRRPARLLHLLPCRTNAAHALARGHRPERRHREWAWLSLASVGLADLYVRLAAMGVFDDPRIL